ncbi:MAG: cell surface protein [Alistipes sp.]|nr:cell surface protein [Alistipes sp.]
MALIASSCNRDDVIVADPLPEIILGESGGVYSVKVGNEVRLAPDYENATDATYSWKIDGVEVGTERSYIFLGEEIGSYYISLSVTTAAGSDSEELRVDVIRREIPTIDIVGESKVVLALGSEKNFNSSVVDTSLDVTIRWSLDGEECGEGASYTFEAQEIGNYTLRATATNSDGEAFDEVAIEVLSAEDMPFMWDFEKESYHTVVGRKLLIAPTQISDTEDVVYMWQLGDEGEAIEGDSHFVFTADTAGEYHITATATATREGSPISITHKFIVTVYEDGAYYRAKSGTSSANWSKVYEYTPAPGQFINETKTGGFDGTQTTSEAAIAYAEARMSDENWVSLGGFGGYIILGFDHSVDNSGDYDFGILGNSFKGSSEPGVVWVMQDENGNGEPDDTWYELAGSETSKAETIQNYAVTYYRPSGAGMPVQWSDNLGNSGEIDYLKQFHRQEYYYPLWIEGESYTLMGTCLQARNYDASGNGSYWVNDAYDWGYADNYSPIDRLTEEDNAEGEINANHFKISNAIDFECKPIHLDYIDFVKVQVAVNAKSGWLGELSTEVCGMFDYNMTK